TGKFCDEPLFYGSVSWRKPRGPDGSTGGSSRQPMTHEFSSVGKQQRDLSCFSITFHNEESFGSQCTLPPRRHRRVAFEVVMIRVSIASPQDIVAIDRARMRETAKTVLEGEEVQDAEVSLAFVDNATIQQLNKRYLEHDEPTDVLSFPLSEPNARRLAGELVIGAEVAQTEAESRGHPVHAELALYVIHG